jgi:putative flippase GtrA
MQAMERFLELARYAIVGLVNAAAYIGLYTILIMAGMHYVLAAIVAYPLPVALGYWLHEHWTFARSQPTMRRLGMFLALQAAAFCVGLGLLVVLVSGLHWNPIVARIVATPIGPIVTYFASRVFIFDTPPTRILDQALHDGSR